MERNIRYPARQGMRVRTKLSWAQVEIMSCEKDELQLMIAGDDESVESLRVEQSGEDIVIAQPQTAYAKELLPTKRWLQICVRLPQGFDGDLDIDTISGTVGAHNITGRDIMLTTVGGAIHTRQIESSLLWLHTVSGAVTGDRLSADRCHVRTVSGNVSLTAWKISTAKVFTVSGEVSLSLCPGARALDTQSISGGVGIIVDGPARASMHSLSGQFVLANNIEEAPGCLEINASSITGDLTVRKKEV